MQYIDNPLTPNRGAIENFLLRTPTVNLPTPTSMRRFFGSGRRNRGGRSRPGMAARRRLAVGSSRTNTRSRSHVGTRATTFQHDASMMYRRKRAPRRVRRRARKSKARFTSNLVKSLGQKSQVFQDVAAFAITPLTLHDSQHIHTVGMYGGIANSAAWGDLYEIAATEGLLSKTGHIHFKSAVLECQIMNKMTSDVLVVDVYEVLARRDGYNEPGEDWKLALQAQSTISGMTSLFQTELNATPFDAPGFGSSWLIKNKTRYRISPGLSVYLQRRDARDYNFGTSRFEYDTTNTTTRVKMFSNMSEGFLIVARSSDINPVTPAGEPFSYQVNATKTYHYGIQLSADDEMGVQ
ncbi:capsid [uncultured virus]|uniref:Capsid n=1 Tax=uncultured virus TaxID=340016 RepID=A0A2K9LSE1_9VIRU|nr:capsid [uncultured virus]